MMDDPAFEQLCEGSLRPVLEGAAEVRSKAMGQFWIRLAIGAAVTLAVIVFVSGTWKFALGVTGLVVTGFVAFGPLGKAAAALKQPVLAAAAESVGAAYQSEGFATAGYERLHGLFGSPTSKRFSDFITGHWGERPFSIYEAVLTRGSGKSRQTVFIGQIYDHQRVTPVQGTTAVVPDKGLFNVFKPGPGMQRVKFESDPEFDRKFEVYSTLPDEARALMSEPVRRQLVELRQDNSRVFVVYEGDMVSTALYSGQDRLEAGNMMSNKPAKERARSIYADMQRSLAQSHRLSETLG